jgi:murein DD-endopeptidase MepM/ murein hydrolase activator NlpD
MGQKICDFPGVILAVIIFLIMKHFLWILPVLLIFSACNANAESGDTLPLLTLYSTDAVVTDTPEQINDAIGDTPTPAATATPVIHIVNLGETISSIAGQYGVSIDAILAVNPEISPNAMIVGDEVVIPAADQSSTSVADASFSGSIRFGQPYCALSTGGLWCSVMVENTADVDLEGTVITFTFVDGEGNVIIEKKVPTVMRMLKSNETVPAFLFLADVPAGYQQVDVSIFSAEQTTLDNAGDAVTVEERDIQYDPLRAVITGKMLVQADSGSDRADLTIAAAAFDAAGNAVGIRRKDVTVARDQNFDFSITVYTSGNEIVDIILYTEVN